MNDENEQNDIEIDEDLEDPTGEPQDELDYSDSEKGKIKELKEKIKALETKSQEYLTGWQRDKADFVNARKRDEESRKELIKLSNERLIDDLLPVLQSFDMAFANKEAWEKVDKNWRVGVEYIYNQLKTIFEQNGLTEINPLGQMFDPYRDEAIEHIPVNEKDKDHKIIEVIQKGYKLNDKIIKPAKVKVGEFKR